MKIKTALILCAGFGKRLSPLTIDIPKPLIEINSVTVLERCIKLIIKLGIKKIYINTFHLKNQIYNFVKKNRFTADIEIVDDGKKILDTGGGILNMMNHSNDENYIIFNPDTLWDDNYVSEINEMENVYFSNKLDNILLTVNKIMSFDKNLGGDFHLNDNLLNRKKNKDFIYIGCQILSRKLFDDYKVNSFSILEIWEKLLKKNKLNGFESINKFYHLTNLETFKKLKDF